MTSLASSARAPARGRGRTEGAGVAEANADFASLEGGTGPKTPGPNPFADTPDAPDAPVAPDAPDVGLRLGGARDERIDPLKPGVEEGEGSAPSPARLASEKKTWAVVGVKIFSGKSMRSSPGVAISNTRARFKQRIAK